MIHEYILGISGTVKGLVVDKPLTVMIGTTYGNRYDMLIENRVTIDSPKFIFSVPRDRGYWIFLPGVQRVSIPCKRSECPFVNSNYTSILTVEDSGNDDSIYKYSWKLQNTSQFGVETINIVPNDEASLINANNLSVESHLDASDAAAKLKLLFGIELHGVWGSEYSSRLLSVVMNFDWFKNSHLISNKNQKWILVDGPLYPQDVEITTFEGNNKDGNVDSKYDQVVKISRDTFKFATKMAIDKKKNGFYFSRRLFKAVIRALCLHRPTHLKRLFKEIHNVDILEPFELEHLIKAGKQLTSYPSNHYQSWFKHPEELIEIATSWHEYPNGLHKVDGLKYFLRRLDGMVNPQEPTAPAIAYPKGKGIDSYIEFMESGFYNYPDVTNLILHEIGHFIDYNTLNNDVRQKWSNIGGWFKDPKDPDGWSTRQQTEFVSAYSHQKNPSEDFASSLADYVLNPRLLQSRAPKKYEFIKNELMGGGHYIIKASHEFKVINLGNPDYLYPGRLSQVDVIVEGRINDAKRVKFVFKLFNSGPGSCATSIRFRLFSDAGTFIDVSLKALKCSHEFNGQVTMNQYKKRGVWTSDQIIIKDDKGLERFVGTSDFGLRVWINNGAEDFQDPKSITTSIAMKIIQGSSKLTEERSDEGTKRRSETTVEGM